MGVSNQRTGSRLLARWDYFRESGRLTLWLLALPFIVFIFVFQYVPLWGWIISFQRYTIGVPLFSNRWVGLYHFERLFSGASNFGQIIVNTLAFSFLKILTSPAPIVVALLLNEIKGRTTRRLVQTITSLPHFVSFVIVFAVFFSFLAIDDGVLNKVLLSTGLICQTLEPPRRQASDLVFHYGRRDMEECRMGGNHLLGVNQLDRRGTVRRGRS